MVHEHTVPPRVGKAADTKQALTLRGGRSYSWLTGFGNQQVEHAVALTEPALLFDNEPGFLQPIDDLGNLAEPEEIQADPAPETEIGDGLTTGQGQRLHSSGHSGPVGAIEHRTNQTPANALH